MFVPPGAIVSLAAALAARSPCRSRRGAVVFTDAGQVAAAHNWRPGEPCDGSEECKSTCRQRAVHAEQAALLAAASHTLGADMLHVKVDATAAPVPSGPPSCVHCAKLMLAAGIRHFWLLHEGGWRRYTARENYDLACAGAREVSRALWQLQAERDGLAGAIQDVHRVFDRAGIPAADGLPCADPECQSKVGHRARLATADTR